MSRSGYDDDYGCDDNWDLIKWRGQVASSIRGKRGQKLLSDLVAALDAMPAKRLISHELREGPLTFVAHEGAIIDKAYLKGDVCALGAVGAVRGIDLQVIDPEDSSTVSATFNIAEPLAREIVYENDERYIWDRVARTSRPETPEERWQRMRDWAVSHIKSLKSSLPFVPVRGGEE